MFLEYGVTDKEELVRIDEVGRGRLDGVYCPYCRRPLLARKGLQIAPHFAHDGETCRAANRSADSIALPAYDSFTLRLSGRELDTLKVFAANGFRGVTDDYAFDRLVDKEMIRERGAYNSGYGATYELTKRGKIPLGQLSLMLFNNEQQALLMTRHDELEAAAYRAFDTPDEQTALTDLRLYRAQWQRVLLLTLYFLEIQHSGGTVHKIGVTSRTVDERTAEIAADLRAAGFEDVKITIIDTWQNRGNVELYFKHRYQQHQHRIGTLTEYFAFDDVKPVIRDLRRMKPDDLTTPLLHEIIDGTPSRVERGEPQEIKTYGEWRSYERWATGERGGGLFGDTAYVTGYVSRYGNFYRSHYTERYEQESAARRLMEEEDAERERQRLAEEEQQRRAQERSAAISAGMKRAAESGQHVGRPKDNSEQIIASYPAVVAALASGMSLRAAAAATGVAINTVRKVKASMDESA